MTITISASDGTPIYQQLLTQLRYQIVSGQRPPGTEMPTIRALALELKINPNTVARAYRELEQEGLVEKRSTQGTFVSDQGSRLSRPHRRKLLEEHVDKFLAHSRQLGFTLDEVLEIVNKRESAMSPQNRDL